MYDGCSILFIGREMNIKTQCDNLSRLLYWHNVKSLQYSVSKICPDVADEKAKCHNSLAGGQIWQYLTNCICICLLTQQSHFLEFALCIRRYMQEIIHCRIICNCKILETTSVFKNRRLVEHTVTCTQCSSVGMYGCKKRMWKTSVKQ